MPKRSARSAANAAAASHSPPRIADEPHWAHWLTRVALVIAVGVVFARATTLETLRNPLDVFPASAPIPRGTGPAEGLWLDLVASLPALLVLLRRVLDTRYTLRFAWSAGPMLLLGAWGRLSTLWAADKFAALVSATHLLAALVLVWSAAQLATTWLRVRLVSAACFGLLLVMLGQGLYYRFVELPDLRAEWQKNGTAILKERGWEPGSFEARQFENRVLGGEMLGFTSSPNSYAAVIVLLSAVGGGLLAQRLARRDEMLPDVARGGTLPVLAIGAALAVGVLVVWLTHSRTAVATLTLGALAFAGVALLRRRLAAHAKPAYFAGVAVVLLGIAAVVGHGLYHGSLPHVSLTFRWRYWSGAASMFAAHPLLGVGYENFGLHYLTHRLPIAAEEVRDPHNLIVRLFAELGLVGGLLLLAWQLRLWWELTRPRVPAEAGEDRSVSAVGAGAAMGFAGLVLSVATSVDFAHGWAFTTIELLRRGGMFCLFLLGTAVAALRAVEQPGVDERPAPWVLSGLIFGCGLFLVHNLIDFSLFEAGPMLLFALVTGTALGARLPERAAGARHRGWAAGALAVGAVAWTLGALALAGPVALAESAAAEGDQAVREERFTHAVSAFEAAADRVPYNADYAHRAAQATYWSGRDGGAWIDRALAAQPLNVKSLLFRARMAASLPSPPWAAVHSDYRRALEIDPQNVPARLEFAGILARAGETAAARDEFLRALEADDRLAPDEPERLKPERVAQVRAAIERLGKP